MSTRNRATDRSSLTISDAVEGLLSDGEPEIRPNTMENSSAVTVGLMKEMMKEMRDGINSDTGALLAVVRNDISIINEKIDKYSDRFDEAETRISNLEDKMANIEDVNPIIYTLQEQLKTAIANYDIDACRARKNNVLIHGLTGTSKDTKVAMKDFLNLCAKDMELDEEWISKLDLKDVYRFPAKKKTDPWPMFVSFNKSMQREEFYRAAPKLKGKGIVIKNDLAPCLIVEKNSLKKIGDKLKEPPTNYQTRFRDTAFKVRLEILKPGKKEWETWKVGQVEENQIPN